MSDNYGCRICEESTGGASACPIHGQRVYSTGQIHHTGSIDFAIRIAELERQFDAEKAAREKAEDSAQVKHQWASALAKTADEYVEQLKTLGDDRNVQRERAEKAQAELARISKRLEDAGDALDEVRPGWTGEIDDAIKALSMSHAILEGESNAYRARCHEIMAERDELAAALGTKGKPDAPKD